MENDNVFEQFCLLFDDRKTKERFTYSFTLPTSSSGNNFYRLDLNYCRFNK